MKAYIFTGYGLKNLHLEDIDKPIPGPEEVLVKVKATAINDWDWMVSRGKPYIYRSFTGISKPKWKIAGAELSGIVEAVGESVNEFNPGDEVYGDVTEFGLGTFAEYVAVNRKSLVLKPSYISFDEATAVPHASILAWQGLVNLGKIKEGEKVLINGAGGGVGIFAAAIAKEYKVDITGVDSSEKLEMMTRLGYNEVIDYRKQDFSRSEIKYDLILDCKSTRSPGTCLKSLKEGGRYVTVGGDIGRLMQIGISGGWYNRVGTKRIYVLPLKPNQGLEHIHKLLEEGKVDLQIDGPYDFEEIPRLIQYFGEGKHKGKIVVKL